MSDENSKSDSEKSTQLSLDDIENAPDSLPKEAQTDAEKIAELIKRIGKLSNENEELSAAVQTLERNARTTALLDDLIEPSARNAFRFMVGYSIAVGVFLLLAGWKAWGFTLKMETLNFLVGSTAVTVVGLVGMVLTGVFIGARGK